ncbi:MAG: class I SAM-dependent methyltransferase [Pseudomonadota bacterium]
MAILWSKQNGNNRYKVTSAGNSIRLYRNSVLHSQWNSTSPVSGHLWDLFILSSLDRSVFRVLVLGAGGGAVINLAHHFFKHSHVDAIEMDPHHIYAAKRFFKVNQKRCTFYQDDVEHWIKNNKSKTYDLIIDDVFFEGKGNPYRSINAHAKWIRRLLGRLNHEGVLVINFADSLEWRQSKLQLQPHRFFKSFNYASASHVNCQNRVIHMSKKDISLLALKRTLKQRIFYEFEKNIKDGIYLYRALTMKAG